jgi:hypothetical protein
MARLNQNSPDWGYVNVTIPQAGDVVSSPARPIVSCLIWRKSGGNAYLNRVGAAVTSPVLPVSITTPARVQVDDLSKLSFTAGSPGTVITIIWFG